MKLPQRRALISARASCGFFLPPASLSSLHVRSALAGQGNQGGVLYSPMGADNGGGGGGGDVYDHDDAVGFLAAVCAFYLCNLKRCLVESNNPLLHLD